MCLLRTKVSGNSFLVKSSKFHSTSEDNRDWLGLIRYCPILEVFSKGISINFCFKKLIIGSLGSKARIIEFRVVSQEAYENLNFSTLIRIIF